MNKKIKIALLTFLIVGLVGAPFKTYAVDYVNAADVTELQTTLDTVNKFLDSLSDSSVPITTVVSYGSNAITQLTSLSNYSFNTTLGSGYSDATTALKADAVTVSAGISRVDADLNAKNLTQANIDVKTLSDTLNKFNDDKTALNTTVDQKNNETTKVVKTQTYGYLALLIATILFSIGSFVWASRGNNVDDYTKKARRKVALASLFPLAGAAITYGTFEFASKSGGTYVIAYGPILFGIAAYARALKVYKLHQKAPPAPMNQVQQPFGGSSSPQYPGAPMAPPAQQPFFQQSTAALAGSQSPVPITPQPATPAFESTPTMPVVPTYQTLPQPVPGPVVVAPMPVAPQSQPSQPPTQYPPQPPV